MLPDDHVKGVVNVISHQPPEPPWLKLPLYTNVAPDVAAVQVDPARVVVPTGTVVIQIFIGIELPEKNAPSQ